jgi:hypothetical protein
MKFSPVCLLACLLGLAACEGSEVRETLGLNRTAPDEFVVYSRPPLSVPPSFDLHPPRPGEEGPGVVSSEDQARETLLGTKKQPSADALSSETPAVDTAVEPIMTSDAPSAAQSSFLQKFGTEDADPKIRSKLGQDTADESKPKKKADSLYERIVGTDGEEPVVDAEKEAARIRQNRDEGKPITEGETPVKEAKPPSVIDKIF